jgi:hypothetical protein
MRTILYSRLVAAISCLAVPGLGSAATVPGVVKTWVSTTGKDVGTCPITAPCQTFQYAHDQTASGGEIDVKDSGGFGQIVITKSINIVAADGVLALISVPAHGDGITVNAGPDDRVSISGVSVDCHKTPASNGIKIYTQTFIKRSTFRGCDIGGNIKTGKASIDSSAFTGNTYGLYVQGTNQNSASAYMANNEIVLNDYGAAIDQYGAFYTYRNNVINNNIIAVTGVNGFTTISLQ